MGLFSKVAGSFVKERVSNTKTAFDLIVEDFKRYVLILKWVFLGLSVATLLYGIISKTGNLIINCSLIGLLFLYSVLDAILRKKANPDPSRKLRIIYAWMKIILNAAALVSSLYSLYSSTITQVKPIEIVLVVLTMLIFVLKVLLEITLEILASKWALLKSAMILDAKEHPNTSAKVFSPLIGDVEEIEVKEAYIKRIKEKQEKE